MSPRLIRAILHCYPKSVRARYGAELAEMLESSPHPLRDLADVARCGLSDRLGRLLWMVTLLIPAGIVYTMVQRPDWYGTLLPGLTNSIAILAGLWLGRRHRGPWYQHPLAALLLISLIWLMPGPGFSIRLTAYVVWIGASMALATGVRGIRQRRSRTASVAVALAGSLVLLAGTASFMIVWAMAVDNLVPILNWEVFGSGAIEAYDQAAPDQWSGVYLPFPLLVPLLSFVLTFAYASGGKHTPQSAKVGLTLT